MKLIILLSVLALSVADYPPAKPAESYGPPAGESSPETPAFTAFSAKNRYASFPTFYHSSYPYSYSSYPFYSSYYNTFKFPTKYQYNYGYKPFSTVALDSPAGLPPILGGGLNSILPPNLVPPNVLPPNILPPNVLPPTLFPPSLKPPLDVSVPQIATFSSSYLPFYSPQYKNQYPSFHFLNSFPTFSPFQSPILTKKAEKQAETYGPPAEEPVETSAPAETSEDAPVSYPYEAAAPEGSSPATPHQEYGPPSSKH